MPNQYARVKNVAKGEDVIKDNTDRTYAFVDDFLEEAMKSVSIYEADEDVDYEYWSSSHQTIMLMQHLASVIPYIINV
jgi:hypothetical protein